MIVTFADGFSSSSAPVLSGPVQENYTLGNNMSAYANFTGLILDKDACKVVDASFEISRYHEVATVPITFRQKIDVTFIWDGSQWNMTTGLSSGSDMNQSSISSPEHVVLYINPASGQVQYKSGNMTGDNYVGELRSIITRIAA